MTDDLGGTTNVSDPDVRAVARTAFRRVVWPVAVLSSEGDDGVLGMTVSSVTSVSLDPPSVVICVNRQTRTHDRLRVGAWLGLSMLSAAQSPLAARLAVPGGDKHLVEEELHRPLDWQVPVVRDAVSGFAVEVAQLVDAFSHIVVIGLVREADLPDEEREPLAYLDGRFVRAVGLP